MQPSFVLGGAMPPKRKQAGAPKAKPLPAKIKDKKIEAAEESNMDQAAKGLDLVAQLPEGASLGQKGAQAVKGQLRRMASSGWSYPMDKYNSLRGHEAKRQFALRLAMDREGSWLKMEEKQEVATSSTKKVKAGWLHIWEIAALESFPYQPDNKQMMEQLASFVDGCAERPSEKEGLAKLGHKQYDYSKRMADTHTADRTKAITASVTTDNVNIEDFDRATKEMEEEHDKMPRDISCPKIKRPRKGTQTIMDADETTKDKMKVEQKLSVLRAKFSRTIDETKEAQLKLTKAGMEKYISEQLKEDIAEGMKKVDVQKGLISEMHMNLKNMDNGTFSEAKTSLIEDLDKTQQCLDDYVRGPMASLKNLCKGLK